MTTAVDPIVIQSHTGPYRVHFADSLATALRPAESGSPAWVLIDELVLRHHGADIAAHGVSAERLVPIEAIEENKSYDRVGPWIVRLLQGGLRRDGVIVAIGGGIVQDIACFIATIVMRGIRWRYVPTTLLAQCDSCIGAKSSINIASFKNQLGSFHAPAEVHVLSKLLGSLPEEALRAGFGEIVKFHLLEGEDAWARIRDELCWNDMELVSRLVERSLRMKQRYIEQDEFDRGIRNLLNYGHTFGHAFESATQFRIPHGLAVALGMSAATFVSERLGLAPVGHHAEVDAALSRIYQESRRELSSASLDAIMRAMRTDKKHVHGASFAILTRGPGRMSKERVDLDNQIRPALADFLNDLSRSRS
jgi:3-dehydroquinate synthase